MSTTQAQQADKIINDHVWFSILPGWLPIPFVDLAAISAVQIDMIRQLCKVYDKEFTEQRGKAVTLALFNTIGTRFPGYLLRSMVKSVPVVGTFLGGAALAAAAGASTYATGIVFKEHFDKGGSLQDINPESFKEFYRKQFMKGKEIVEEMTQNDPPAPNDTPENTDTEGTPDQPNTEG